MKNQFENSALLMQNVKDKVGKPVSVRVVTATIESFGIRDIDVPDDYGFESIKSLADYIFKEINISSDYSSIKNIKEQEAEYNDRNSIQLSDYMSVKAKLFAKYYPLGIFHLLPFFIQIVAIIIFGYSLWTFVGFNEVQSTAVVLGVILGLVLTGGFVQVMGRQASFYMNYKDYIMTRHTVYYLIKKGIRTIAFSIIAIFVINFFFHIYPYQLLIIVSVYAFLIGFLLLVFAPFHTIQKRWVISITIFVATAVAVYCKQMTVLKIYYTHWIGIIVAIILSILYLAVYFKLRIGRGQNDSNIRVKSPVMIYLNYQYFLYGIFIYLFIFVDRILAWSSGIEGYIPFVIYFEKDYELGMDMAILVFLLLSGVLEYSIASFTRFIDIGQKLTSFETPSDFNKSITKMYWQNVMLLIGSASLVFVLIYFIITASWGYQGQFHEVLQDITIRVCVIGGLGYFFLAWGMLNTLYLFTLGKPSKPLRAIILAFAINVFVGFVFSRFVSYEYSVVGMLCGSLFFMIITLKENIKFLKNLDYHYYAAY